MIVLTAELATEVARVLEKIDLWDEMDLEGFITQASTSGFEQWEFPVLLKTKLILGDDLSLATKEDPERKRSPLTAQDRARIAAVQHELAQLLKKRWELGPRAGNLVLNVEQAGEIIAAIAANCGGIIHGAEVFVEAATTRGLNVEGLKCGNGLSFCVYKRLLIICHGPKPLNDEQKASWLRAQVALTQLRRRWHSESRLAALKAPKRRPSALAATSALTRAAMGAISR